MIRLLLVTLWLVPCAWYDWRARRVPNALTVPAFLLAWPLALWRGPDAFLFTALAFLLAAWGWRMGYMGGADVKATVVVAALAPEVLLASALVNAALVAWNLARGRGLARTFVPGLVVFLAAALLAALVVNLQRFGRA